MGDEWRGVYETQHMEGLLHCCILSIPADQTSRNQINPPSLSFSPTHSLTHLSHSPLSLSLSLTSLTHLSLFLFCVWCKERGELYTEARKGILFSLRPLFLCSSQSVIFLLYMLCRCQHPKEIFQILTFESLKSTTTVWR